MAVNSDTTPKATAAGAPAGGGRKTMWIVVAAVVVLAVAAGAVYLATKGGSSNPKQTSASAPVIAGHQFFAPECAPVKASPWTYPGPAKIHSDMYESFASHLSCAQAATWTKQLAEVKLPIKLTGTLTDLRGPDGYKCEAFPDKDGYAYAGGCRQTGTKSEFGWNWNVANSREALVKAADGTFQTVKQAGADTETILRPRGPGHYQLEVLNTSGIGFLDGFTWSAPPDWTIKAITKTTGSSTCTLTPEQLVVCTGKVAPPTCLCSGSGGVVKVELAVVLPKSATTDGHRVSTGTVGAKLRITAMTAVPYLIPGTPKEAKRQKGV